MAQKPLTNLYEMNSTQVRQRKKSNLGHKHQQIDSYDKLVGLEYLMQES